MIKIIKEDPHIVLLIIMAVIAVVLETFGVLPEKILLPLTLLLLALFTFFQIIHGTRLEESANKIEKKIGEIELKVRDPEILLVKPPHLYSKTSQIAHLNKGDVYFFNMCSHMFMSDEVRDQFIRPFLLNKNTKSLTFINKIQEKELWDTEVAPKLAKYKNSEIINEPIYKDIEEHIAFVMTELRSDKERREALLAIWGEPFMAGFTHPKSNAKAFVPRYYILIKSYSDLIPRLKDIWDKYRF